MRFIQNLSTATPDTIHQELLHTVEQLLRLIRQENDVLDLLQQVRDLLESLPFSSDEYSTAVNRLRNTHRYLVSQERGAARYELQLLAGSLRNERVRQVGPRMRRRRIQG